MAQALAEKLEHTGSPEKERLTSVPQRERAVGKHTRAALAKTKRNRAVCPEHQILRGERVKVSESRTLAREREIRARAWGERVTSTVKEGRFQGEERGQARRASLGDVEGSRSG